MRRALGLLALVACTAAFVQRDRLKYLAVPTLTRPAALAPAAPTPLAERAPCPVTRVASVGHRVGAILEANDGSLWVGTFDHGLTRDGVAVAAVGRQRFVNALREHDGRIFAATYGGVLEFEPDGTERPVQLAGIAVEALAEWNGALVAGTVRGLYVKKPGAGFEAIALAESPRVTSLAVNGGALWLGTPEGVYEATGAWHPLVFGPTASSTNVVMALAAWRDGVLALTDDGGLVDVQPGVEVLAHRFTEPRANEGNAGAVAVVGGIAFFGTQGGGLVVADESQVGRPRRWPIATVTALASGRRLLLGDDAGDVYVLDCSK